MSRQEVQLPSRTGNEPRGKGTSDSNLDWNSSNNALHVKNPSTSHSATSRSSDQLVTIAFGNVQESCLLRYFVEEISPWVRLIFELT